MTTSGPTRFTGSPAFRRWVAASITPIVVLVVVLVLDSRIAPPGGGANIGVGCFVMLMPALVLGHFAWERSTHRRVISGQQETWQDRVPAWGLIALWLAMIPLYVVATLKGW